MNVIAQRLIEAELKLAGVLPEHLDIVAAVIAPKLRQNDDGDVDVTDDAGNIRIGADTKNMSIAELLAELKRQSPVFFIPPIAAQQPKPATMKPLSITDRMVRDLREMRSVDRKAERAAEISKAGNPWLPSNRSMTRQAQITNLDPALAAQLKQEAQIGHD